VLRGDIDALPIHDGKPVDYRSTCPGLMHACGHDAHPAIVYGTLRVLNSMRLEGLLPWPLAVRGLFQPAEETASGAMAMIHAHALREASAALALHVDPSRPVGSVGLRAGTLTASCDTFRVHFSGMGGHGARPHLTADPIEAAAHWITTALRRVPRSVSPHSPVVLSMGSIHAGHASNVIPDEAVVEGTIRTLSKTTRLEALEVLEDINESVIKESGVKIKLQLMQSAPPVENDERITKLVAAACDQVLGAGHCEWIEEPSMGSEDFSYYLDHVPGTMFRLGVAGEQVGHAPLHTPHFDIDEQCLAVGIRVMTATAIRYFASEEPTAT
jgi:amidohydrolase